MERGRGSQGRGKPKNQHFPSDLFVLGSKSGSTDGSKRTITAGGVDRKREAGPSGSISLLPSKKPKTGSGPSGINRPSSSSPTSANVGLDIWEIQAIDIDAPELVSSVLECYQANQVEKAAHIICGGLKILKNSKWKPDPVLTMGLICLAKMKPSIFTSEIVTQALSYMLKRDPQHNFKSKGNPLVAVLAANLLSRGYLDSKHWPTTFIKLYVEDAMAERVWVDQVECKGFVSNLLTGFGTKLPPQNINLLVPELGPLGINRADSPLTISMDDDEECVGISGSADIPIFPRFSKALEAVEQIVLDLISNRRQTPESVTRNYLKLLSSAAGILEIRVVAAPRLEMWLQNPKLMKPAQELLLSICVNCATHSQKDVQVIGALVKIRLKTKALITFYLTCIRELINAHPENISTSLKHVIFNELSTARNPNNMSMISVVFQSQPEQSAALLAEVFLELLMNRDDYLRPLRVLLREIVRCLRHDINLLAFCRGLMADKRDLPMFRDFEFKERMFCAIIDLLTHACLLGVSPAVKESVNLVARGDKREIQTLISFHTMVATIEQEAVSWIKDQSLKIYRPSGLEFAHALHKIVFMENQEAYYKVDMWPPESERALVLRLAAESPLYENTLFNILVIGLSKEHPLSSRDALDLADQVVKRSAALSSDTIIMLSVSRTEIFDLALKATAYHHPDNISLPQGYTPPRLAISNCYWKAWIMMLMLSAHNPATLGEHAWEKYPTLRMLMEMCITNHFSFPPPTMLQIENQEESKAVEARLTQRERESILEFEKHLAAASTKATITEATSLLLDQLITMDPSGPARKPPQAVSDQLGALNASHRLGHLLCRSRHPDFLLDLIQRQGASQSMPWLADLVENSESSLSHLPVQCLCEFLLTSGPPDKQSKGQQLIAHLQHVLTDPQQDPNAPCEVMEYLLRRLSSEHMNSRIQAIKGLKLVLASSGTEKNELSDYLQDSVWLLHNLPSLPHFSVMRPQVVAALRQACQVENDPACIASYIHFLAVHTGSDPLSAMSLLVQDMAQLIVERSTIMNAIMPDGSRDQLRANTLHSLIIIFYSYLEKARQPPTSKYWSENPDQVLVQWSTGEEATFHILVVNAMIILLSYGPCNDVTLFNHLLDAWFPLHGDLPKAYLVETSEEALLIPDWLKLRMIRSGVERLVDAALHDLGAKQLVLFVQSFGIPVSSMSRLLETIDAADPAEIAAANFDKHYMLQLVQVQGRRGATGGQRLVHDLRLTDPPTNPPAFQMKVPKKVLEFLPSKVTPPKFQLHMISVLFNEIFSVQQTPDNRREAYRKLQRMVLVDAKTHEEKVQGVSILLQHLMTITKSYESLMALIRVLDEDPANSSLTLRLLWTLLQPLPESFQNEFIAYMQQIKGMISSQDPALQTLMNHITSASAAGGSKGKQGAEPKIDAISAMMEGNSETIGQAIDQLVCSEPELISSQNEAQVGMLLFGKPVKTESAKSVIETCRPYLLTLLTHRASWRHLQTLVNKLLSKFEKFYSPTSVLDFLEALTRNPRLWQGREKHIPKHQEPELVLKLTENQVVCLVEYIIEEAEGIKGDGKPEEEQRPVFLDTLESRLPLLLEPLHQDFFASVVKKLASFIEEFPQLRSNICKHLMILLYFHVPGLIKYLHGSEKVLLLQDATISGWSSSTLDKLSHTLLSALTLTSCEIKDWSKRSQDFELAARKMAVIHPALVLRQLPMVAASLHGRVHLEYHVLRKRNHINVFSQVFGLVDLLQPKVFAREHTQPFQLLLDAYLTLFKSHGHTKDVMPMIPKFVALLQNYVVNDASAASKYLQGNSHSFIAIQRVHPNLTPLRSLLSSILTLRDDNGEETEGPQASMVVTTPVDFVTQPPGPIVAALNNASGEELLPALLELDHISIRHPAVLEAVGEQISGLLLCPYSNIRNLAHTLIARLLKHNPKCSVLTGYLRCLESGQGEIVTSALEKLPDIVVNAQEHAVVLLEKVFSLGVKSSLNTFSYISKAIALLNQQKGC